MRWWVVMCLLLGGCQPSLQLSKFSCQDAAAWGLECHAPPHRDGQLWYFTCAEGSRHAETVDAVDLHDGDGFTPWCTP